MERGGTPGPADPLVAGIPERIGIHSAAERLDAALGRVPGRLRHEFLSHSERNSSSSTQGTLTTTSPGSVVAVSGAGPPSPRSPPAPSTRLRVSNHRGRRRDPGQRLRSACRRHRRRTGGRGRGRRAASTTGSLEPRMTSPPEPPTTSSTEGRIEFALAREPIVGARVQGHCERAVREL